MCKKTIEQQTIYYANVTAYTQLTFIAMLILKWNILDCLNGLNVRQHVQAV